MANEITVLAGNGDRQYDLLFLFPVTTPKQVAGANVAPTPSSALPALAASILTQTEKDALDAGASAFRVVQFQLQAGATNPQLVARVRDIYAQEKIEFDRWYAATYLHAGTRLNATA